MTATTAAASAGDRTSLGIEVLGPLRVVNGDREVGLTRASHRRLLSILALDTGRRLGTDVLIDRFWPENAPTTARAALQTHISALRGLLPADLIVTEAAGYRLDGDRHELDVAAFGVLAAEAQQAAATRAWDTALELAGAALATWRGAPYAELVDDDFARAEIARLEELRLELLELRAEALLATGRSAEALPDLERLVVENPLRERLWACLMRARHRLGRRAEALDAYREAWDALAEVGLEPSAGLRRLQRDILAHDDELTESPPNNLPLELTRFIGRGSEMETVGDLVAEHRLVTLTGVGGAGKTRLALRVAAGRLDSYPDGSWLTELAPLRDPELVGLEVARAIGLPAHGGEVVHALTQALGRGTTLIVLDNCEHVLEGAATVVRALLEAGPRVSVLATSREPLRVPGEVVFEVPPMAYPPPGERDVRAYEAVQLFEERASRARHGFAVVDATAQAVAQICRRLDGIPLALELAAARVGSMDPETIARRLDDRFRLLTGGSTTGPERHRTLAATFDWSYDLLDERERLLFARTSVFRGTFPLDAAAEVCADDLVEKADVVSLVAALVDKSLVSSVEVGSHRRYRLLETLREYAHEHLEDTDDNDEARRRHAQWYVRFAADAVARVYGAGRWELFERLDAEGDNLEQALEWALAAGYDADAATLAHALAWHARDRGQLERCATLLGIALERSSDPTAEVAMRSLLGSTLFLAGDGETAYAEEQRSVDLVAGLEPSAHNVGALTTFARLHLLLVDRDPRDAIPLSRRALEMAEATGDSFSLVYALRSLGRAQVWSGEPDEGVERYRTALDLAIETGDRALMLETYEQFFSLLFLHPQARRDEPRRLAEEFLGRFPSSIRRWGRNSPSDWLPSVFLQTGELDRAEEQIDRLGARHLESWDRTNYLTSHACLRWMQGRLREARSDLAVVERAGLDPHWYHEYFPLLVGVAADQGDLVAVQDAADAYLALEVHPVEEPQKVVALHALARAEADAALAASDDDASEHIERARAAVERARAVLDSFPPLAQGSFQMETPATYLAFAEAELTRVTAPDPAAWRACAARADHAHMRLYARWRMAEALVETGEHAEAEREIAAARADASEIGAAGVLRQLDELAARLPARAHSASAARRSRRYTGLSPRP